MKEDEARTLVTLLAAATSTRLLTDEVEVWVEQFRPLDADLVYKAIMRGRAEWSRFPSWKNFKEGYNIQVRLSEPVGEQRDRPEQEETKYGGEPPEWVYVKSWCWRTRAPRNVRSFPQEEGYADPQGMMTLPEYEALRAEWVAAGSPKPRLGELFPLAGKT